MLVNDIASIVGQTSAIATVDTLAFVAGVGVLGLAMHVIKRRRKRQDFLRQTHQEEAEPRKFRPFWRAALGSGGACVARVAGATLAAGLILGSYEWVSAAVSAANAWLGGLLPQAASPALRVLAGLALIEVSGRLYARAVSRKHPPIFMRYYVDGFMAPTRFFHPKTMNIRRSLLVLRAQSEETRGMHSKTVMCAKVRSKDYRSGKSKDMWMAYRSDLEPHEVERELTTRDAEAVLTFLREHADTNETICASNIADLADQTGLYAAADRGEFNAEDKTIDTFDVGRIVKAVVHTGTDDVAQLDVEQLVKRLNHETLYNIGGYFQANVYDGKPFSLRVSMRENIVQSDAISRDPRGGYGADYAEKGDMLMVFQYRCYESGKRDSDDSWVEAGAAGAGAGSGATNVVREDRKAWNQLMRHGLGRSYLIYWGDKTYIYDESWFRSGKFVTELIPGLHGREHAIRRIGYVYDYDGSIVAKVTDDPATVLAKALGNCNRMVDVYDAALARDENFGALLCALSRFLTYQHKYRRNRIQEVLPVSAPFGGADADVAGQV